MTTTTTGFEPEDEINILCDGDEKATIRFKECQYMKTISNIIEDIGKSDCPIPLPNIDLATFEKIKEYAIYVTEHPEVLKKDNENNFAKIDEWTREFCMKMDTGTLFKVMLAANYVDCKSLVDATCSKVAASIKGKTPDEIRTIYDLKNSFTKEEEEQLRKENEWCEDL